MNLIRNSVLDKHKLYTNIPLKFRLSQAQNKPLETFDGFVGVDSKDLKN